MGCNEGVHTGGQQWQQQWCHHGMGWVPICDDNGNPFDCIALHLAIAVAITPNMNSCDDAVAVAIAQCEQTLKALSHGNSNGIFCVVVIAIMNGFNPHS